MRKTTRVLIAEDEGIIAKDIANTLKKLGYEVIGIVREGAEAIKQAEILSPSLVIMDIMLNDHISGIEAAKNIQDNFDIPVIYLTALADEETLHKAKITEPYGYIIKPFDERTLHSSIEMALYKHDMSQKLRERTIELEEEKKKSESLLHNILPMEIVKELKENGIIAPREFELVTLLFTDFQGFTSLATQMPPHILVNELNDIFNNFDSILDSNNLEKLKTIGDSYMVAGGLPKENNTHAFDVINAAIEMNKYLDLRNKDSKYQWKMRTGVHSGNVVAGIIGKNKFTYDVWGETVNIASRMERFSQPGRINITAATHALINSHFECEYHNKAELMKDYWIDMYFIKNSNNSGHK